VPDSGRLMGRVKTVGGSPLCLQLVDRWKLHGPSPRYQALCAHKRLNSALFHVSGRQTL